MASPESSIFGQAPSSIKQQQQSRDLMMLVRTSYLLVTNCASFVFFSVFFYFLFYFIFSGRGGVNFCEVAKLAMIHNDEDSSVNFGYKLNMKPKKNTHPFYIFGYLLEKMQYGDFFFFQNLADSGYWNSLAIFIFYLI